MKQTHRIDRADCMNGEEDQEERKTFSREGFKTRRKQGKKEEQLWGEKCCFKNDSFHLYKTDWVEHADKIKYWTSTG